MPSPVNRLDRNTTGLVMFGKTAPALQTLNYMLREKDYVSKYYLTVVAGNLKKELILTDRMSKDTQENKVYLSSIDSGEGKIMETIARPLSHGGGCTLVEVELVTGRTHQIRAHLSGAGYPVIGDGKYGRGDINGRMAREFSLTTQLLHSHKLVFNRAVEPLAYLKGKEVKSELPQNFALILEALSIKSPSV